MYNIYNSINIPCVAWLHSHCHLSILNILNYQQLVQFLCILQCWYSPINIKKWTICLQCWDWVILTQFSKKYTKFWLLFKRNSNLILTQKCHKSNFYGNYVTKASNETKMCCEKSHTHCIGQTSIFNLYTKSYSDKGGCNTTHRRISSSQF